MPAKKPSMPGTAAVNDRSVISHTGGKVFTSPAIRLVRSRGAQQPGRPKIRLAALRVPLAAKLTGANLLVVASLLGIWLSAGGSVTEPIALVIGGVIGLHLVLVLIALRPIRDLEIVAARVWQGDYAARVERSSIADREVLRIGSMFNLLLDGLASDRTRLRALAAEVIAAGDRERAALARELHDSTAQHLAALQLQLAAAARDANDSVLAQRLREARDAAQSTLEEVRALSHSVHPAVLDDLGLDAALRRLAREASHGTGVDIDVDADSGAEPLPPNVATVLYRVAQEAVRNAIRHAAPQRVRINLLRGPDAITLEVHDDGRGFDLEAAEDRRTGMGLLSMRERTALIDGTVEIRTTAGGGTTVVATVPLDNVTDAHETEYE
jgi:signal transduction histidine kinase